MVEVGLTETWVGRGGSGEGTGATEGRVSEMPKAVEESRTSMEEVMSEAGSGGAGHSKGGMDERCRRRTPAILRGVHCLLAVDCELVGRVNPEKLTKGDTDDTSEKPNSGRENRESRER